ncbi:hypothetical protein ACQP04_25025 [Pseudonocardia halophobica]|uniref:hypothetical protein n=1 Tax=Pseudonocardia halophobica TaxID=29401 RepID=UPI003D8AD067
MTLGQGPCLNHPLLVYARRHATHRREAFVVNRQSSSLEEPFLSQMQAFRREHENALRAIISDGVIDRFAVDSPVLASFAIREMYVSIARWHHDDGPIGPEQVAHESTEFTLNVVGLRQIGS